MATKEATIKKKVGDVVAAYRIISREDTKVTKMLDNEKFEYVRKLTQVKKVGVEFDEFVKEAQKRLKPEGMDAIIEKMQKREELTTEEQALVNKYDTDVSACVKEELDKEATLNIAPWSEETLGRFIASNDWSVNAIMHVIDVLGE